MANGNSIHLTAAQFEAAKRLLSDLAEDRANRQGAGQYAKDAATCARLAASSALRALQALRDGDLDGFMGSMLNGGSQMRDSHTFSWGIDADRKKEEVA